MLQRRTFLAIGASALIGRAIVASAEGAADPSRALAEIEAKSGGRLGVYARDVGSGRAIAYRANDLFPMCSTFKILLVSAVLQRVDRRQEQLTRHISYGKADLEAYAPVTTAHVAEGMLTVAQLCEAAIVVSDNTAANLLLRTVGGPAGVTAFMRAHPLDDPTTRLDRNEPTLNTAIPGDRRDTTTPSRMVNALAILLTTNEVLTSSSSRMLESWMRRCKTGTTALRAGAPASWVAGDKTGSGENATRNDVAIFRRPQRAPVIVAAYLTRATRIGDTQREKTLAQVGRITSAALS
ncbi:MAG TPA: class A beta-lactamase [Candidatus Baltobacteraceae bacterium]